MRIIEVGTAPIRTLAVSPDSRFVAASTDGEFGIFLWATGEVVAREAAVHPLLATLGNTTHRCTQMAFAPDGNWLACGCQGHPLALTGAVPHGFTQPSGAKYAGGVAVSPDGKLFIAVLDDGPNKARLHRWSLPAMRAQIGFDFWSPFRKLAFSANGDYIAGIWPGVARRWQPDPAEFELRFAQSGGLDYRFRPHDRRAYNTDGFISFTRDSGLCAFGWDGEFRVLDTSTGTSKERCRVEATFRDAAFTGSGRHFATVEASGVLKLWDVTLWKVVREYDWGCGPLTCVAFTADGSAGVCGTADGRLVQFDVDE